MRLSHCSGKSANHSFRLRYQSSGVIWPHKQRSKYQGPNSRKLWAKGPRDRGFCVPGRNAPKGRPAPLRVSENFCGSQPEVRVEVTKTRPSGYEPCKRPQRPRPVYKARRCSFCPRGADETGALAKVNEAFSSTTCSTTN
jgi:hypothetical protein